MGFTESQQIALAIVPKFSAVMSIVGSSFIILEVLYLDRSKLKRVYHRLLLAMSMYDVLVACAFFMSTWPIPSGTEGVAFASGNIHTCVWQGFMIQFGIVTPLLNMGLCIYYLLVIRYSWKEEDIRKRAEPLFHIVPLMVALGTCSASVALDLFNNANLWCWIATFPLGCEESFEHDGETTCLRGDNADIYRWAFYYGWVWFIILFAMFAMISLYLTFWRLEQANSKYAGSSTVTPSSQAQTKPKGSRSRQVAMQGLWYVGAFYLTFLFATINRLVQVIAGKTIYALLILQAFFVPAQGMWNYLVYIRPRYLKYRGQNPQAGFLKAVKNVLYDEYSKHAREATDDDENVEQDARKEMATWRRRLRNSLFRTSISRTSAVAGEVDAEIEEMNGQNEMDVEMPEERPEEGDKVITFES